MRAPNRSLSNVAIVVSTFALLVPFFLGIREITAGETKQSRPNILFAIADDWGWPHAGAYGDPVVKTPTFDRLAKEGALFHHAYISSPSCTPSRGAVLTGQWHWRLEGAGNLWSVFPDKFAAYRQLLAACGVGPGQVCFVGDDLPDLPLLRNCGLAVAVADACPEARVEAHYVTRAGGGRGAVRETIELILRCQGAWQQVVEAYRSERL